MIIAYFLWVTNFCASSKTVWARCVFAIQSSGILLNDPCAAKQAPINAARLALQPPATMVARTASVKLFIVKSA
jgi:hypothetical protein